MAEKYPSWSPYNYVMNNPLGMVDPDGREVVIVFNKATGQLFITNLDHHKEGLPTKFVTAKDYVFGGIRNKEGKLTHNQVLVLDNVFSGGRSDNDGNISRDLNRDPNELPIPNGKYDLLEYEKKSAWYKVDPIDERRYDDHHQGHKNNRGVTRSGYRLHLGGISWGCITVCNTNKDRTEEWKVVETILNSTSKTTVPARERRLLRINDPHNRIQIEHTRLKYGTVLVKGQDRIK